MKSQARGKDTSEVEVLNISAQGLWLLVRDKEYFLPYDQYPWFRNARISEICHLDLVGPNHLHWPDLDIDLEVEALENPKNYPLIYSAAQPM